MKVERLFENLNIEFLQYVFMIGYVTLQNVLWCQPKTFNVELRVINVVVIVVCHGICQGRQSNGLFGDYTTLLKIDSCTQKKKKIAALIQGETTAVDKDSLESVRIDKLMADDDSLINNNGLLCSCDSCLLPTTINNTSQHD